MSITDARLLDHDPTRGVTNYFYSNADGTEYTIETRQDLAEFVELTKWARNRDFGRWGEWEHVASYPPVIVMMLKEKGLWDDEEARRRWLNDRDNEAFRVRPGKL